MALSRVLLRRAGALTLAATLALSTGAAAVLAADPPTTSDPGPAAAGWIAGQVEAGNIEPRSGAWGVQQFPAQPVRTGCDVPPVAIT